MATQGKISRNIREELRWKILELDEQMRPWPGDGQLIAINSKNEVRLSYFGTAGYQIAEIRPDDDHDIALEPIRRIVEHHRNKARLMASYAHERMSVDYDFKTRRFAFNDMPKSAWQWEVPAMFNAAMHSEKLTGDTKSYLKGEIFNRSEGRSESFSCEEARCTITGTTSNIIDSDIANVDLFSIKTSKYLLSQGLSRYHLKLRSVNLPKVIDTDIKGRRLSAYVQHPLINDDVLIMKMERSDHKRDIVDIDFQLQKQMELAGTPPIQALEDVLQIQKEWRSL